MKAPLANTGQVVLLKVPASLNDKTWYPAQGKNRGRRLHLRSGTNNRQLCMCKLGMRCMPCSCGIPAEGSSGVDAGLGMPSTHFRHSVLPGSQETDSPGLQVTDAMLIRHVMNVDVCKSNSVSSPI